MLLSFLVLDTALPTDARKPQLFCHAQVTGPCCDVGWFLALDNGPALRLLDRQSSRRTLELPQKAPSLRSPSPLTRSPHKARLMGSLAKTVRLSALLEQVWFSPRPIQWASGPGQKVTATAPGRKVA